MLYAILTTLLLNTNKMNEYNEYIKQNYIISKADETKVFVEEGTNGYYNVTIQTDNGNIYTYATNNKY